MYDSLNETLLKHANIPKSALDQIENLIKVEKKPKNSIILRPGEKSNSLYFVNKGLVKSYMLNDDAKEVILNLFPENSWFTDIQSFFYGMNSSFYYKTIENSEIYSISKENFDMLIEKYPEFQEVIETVTRLKFVELQKRYVNQVMKNAKERYLDFLTEETHLAQRVSQRVISSYLGITPEFLSKIRKN